MSIIYQFGDLFYAMELFLGNYGKIKNLMP
jgi:hypothetical protein